MSIFDTLSKHAVVPATAIDDAKNAIALADALIEGGLPVAEITFRTAAAREAIENIAKQRPDLLLGAGTVLDEAQLDQARDAGAQFALSPGLDVAVLRYASELKFPFAIGNDAHGPASRPSGQV